MTIKISVCIPTYNRAAFIGETIESIISQADDGIEIVVSDNASSDNTEEVVREYRQRFPNLVYYRQAENMGFDRNVLKVVELASGEYCWLMGSDDRMEPGALAYVMDRLSAHSGLSGISVNSTMYAPDMRTVLTSSSSAGRRLSADRLFSDAEACFSLLGLYFGYLSAQIVNRVRWKGVVAEGHLDPCCNGFIHIYMLGSVLKQNPDWLYIHRACVGYRSGNDSLLKDVGLYGRQVMAHAHNEAVVRALFGCNSSTYTGVLRMALTDYMCGDIVSFKSQGISVGTQLKLLGLYTRLYWRFPFFWLKVVPLFGIPNSLIEPLRGVYRTWSKRRIVHE